MKQHNQFSPRDAGYWQAIYEEGDIGWDKGEPAPPLVRWFDVNCYPRETRIMVPGCGFGHEAVFLATQGYQVTAVDFALGAIASLSARAGNLPLRALHLDIFDLPHDFACSFDLVIEHTCFCAIPINMRDAYVEVMHDSLKPGGNLLGLFYETDHPEGPPFKTTRADIEHHFLEHFEMCHLERPHDSFYNRQGKEWLAHLRKR